MICSKAEVLVYLRKSETTLSGTDDALLDLIHPLVESAVQNYLQNDVNFAAHIEYLPVGNPRLPSEYPLENYQKQGESYIYQGLDCGSEIVKLTQTPVSVTGLRVWEDVNAYAGQSSTPYAAATELTIGVDFFLDVGRDGLSTSGILYRVGGWPTEPRCIKASYYGGWTAQQLVGRKAGALKLATLLQIAYEFNATRRVNAKTGIGGGYKREKIGKYEYELSDSVSAYVMGIEGNDLLQRTKELLQPYRTYKYL